MTNTAPIAASATGINHSGVEARVLDEALQGVPGALGDAAQFRHELGVHALAQLFERLVEAGVVTRLERALQRVDEGAMAFQFSL